MGEYLMTELTPMLEKDGIKLGGADLTKYASKRINPENELMLKLAQYEEASINCYLADQSFKKAYEALDLEKPLEKSASAATGLLGAG